MSVTIPCEDRLEFMPFHHGYQFPESTPLSGLQRFTALSLQLLPERQEGMGKGAGMRKMGKPLAWGGGVLSTSSMLELFGAGASLAASS